MQRDRFVAARRERWSQLEALLKRGRRLHRLSGEEVLRLGRLYRSATSDLAIARRDLPDDRVTIYLNALLGRAHPLIYRESVMDAGRIWRFYRYGFPATFRSAWRYIVVAFGLFAIAAVVSALLVVARPPLADVLLPGEAQSLRAVLQHHHLWVQSATSNHSVAANFIMLNNIGVAFQAFAGGVLLGLWTLVVLVQNGLSFGTVTVLAGQYGLGSQLIAFVVPHGVIELSVIFMAGGAGLMLADAILRPGLLRRRDALVIVAHRSVRLLFGAVPLLIIAGTIEGFFSPSIAPMALKFGVGALTGILLYSYLLLSREPT